MGETSSLLMQGPVSSKDRHRHRYRGAGQREVQRCRIERGPDLREVVEAQVHDNLVDDRHREELNPVNLLTSALTTKRARDNECRWENSHTHTHTHKHTRTHTHTGMHVRTHTHTHTSAGSARHMPLRGR